MNNKSAAKEVGDWTNNSEMNPAVNSPVTEDSVVRSGDKENAQESWREGSGGTSSSNARPDFDHAISAGAVAVKDSESGSAADPGRTPGKAEGVENPDKQGNEE